MGASPLSGLLRQAMVPALCLLIGGYFLTHAATGPSGLAALDEIRADKARLLAEQRALAEQKKLLEHRIGLLDPRGADPDYADELVRRHLGVIRPDEVVVALPEPEDPEEGGG